MPTVDRTWAYQTIALDALTAANLCKTAEDWSDETAMAALITVYDHAMPWAEKAQALFLIDSGRLGIAWGGDVTWADVNDFATGVDMWLYDDSAWRAAN